MLIHSNACLNDSASKNGCQTSPFDNIVHKTRAKADYWTSDEEGKVMVTIVPLFVGDGEIEIVPP